MTASGPDLIGWDFAAFRLGQRDPRLTANFVAVVELDQEPDWNLVRSRLALAVSNNPVLRWRINHNETGLETVSEVDLAECVKALPVTADVASAAAELVCRRFHAGDLLWRLRIVRGFKRPLILASFNHAVADGQAGLEMLRLLEVEAEQVSSKNDSVSAESSNQVWQRFLSDLILRPGQAVGAINSLMKSLADLWQSLGTDQSPTESMRGGQIKTAWFELPGLRSNLGQSAKLAASSAEAFATYSRAQGRTLSQVSLNLPISIRASSGNRIAVVRHQLQVSELATMTREVSQTYRKWSQDPAMQLAGDIAEAVTSLPGDFLSGALRSADLTVTLLPAPNLPQQIGGAKVRAVYPTVGTGGAAANISVLATSNGWYVGTTWDSSALDAEWPAHLAASLSNAFGVEAIPARLQVEAPNAR